MARKNRRSDFLTLEGLGYLTPADTEKRINEQKAAFAAKADHDMWAQSDEAERAEWKATRNELYTPTMTEAISKTPDLFAIRTKEYKEKYMPSIFTTLGEVQKERGFLGVGELVIPMMAYNGFKMPSMRDPQDVAALGQAAICSLMGYDFDTEGDQQLAWGWGNIRRMFTPPARVRKILKVPKALSKVIRFAGAIQTLPLTLFSGKLRNQAFGLKGNEMKMFDSAAKIGRITAVATATLVGLPAITGGMSGTAAGNLGTGVSGPGGGFLSQLTGSKIGAFIIKDVAKDMVMRVAKDALGNIVGEKFNKDQIPPEQWAAMPDNTPVPTSMDPSMSSPPMVAGGGGMDPNSDHSGEPEPEGSADPFSQSMRDQSSSPQAETRLDPAERSRFLTPSKTAQLVDAITEGKTPADAITAAHDQARRFFTQDAPDDVPLKDLIAKGKTTPAQEALEAEMIDGQPSLRATAAYIRRTGRTAAMPALRKRSKTRKGKGKSHGRGRHAEQDIHATLEGRRLSDMFGAEADKRRLARLYKIVHG